MLHLQVGIIGARISGSYLAWLLARSGFDVWMFDHNAGNEKACGGGLPYKAYRLVPGLENAPVPKTTIRTMVLINDRYSNGIRSPLDPPIMIFSRKQLDAYLRGQAIACGARFVEQRVDAFTRSGDGWALRAGGITRYCNFLIGADGARSMLKSTLGRPFAKEDLSLALGCYLPGNFHSDTLYCRFFRAPFQGYLWSFPRQDHLSVGIMHSMGRADANAMRAMVEAYIRVYYPGADLGQCRNYAATVPTLRPKSLVDNLISGDRWAVVGDAAGFADPISGEGIYCALRSSEILAQCLLEKRPQDYPGCCRDDFERQLQSAARWKVFFYGRNPGSPSLADLALRLAARSVVFRKLLSDWAAGQVLLTRLPARFLSLLPRIALECLPRERWNPAAGGRGGTQ